MLKDRVGAYLSDPEQVLVFARPNFAAAANPANARVITPLGQFAPADLTDLGADGSALLRTKAPCVGLCPVAAQPGPHATATVDPSARLFITFNEPIMKGPCFDEEASDCVVTLKPVLHGKREYVLSEVEIPVKKINRNAKLTELHFCTDFN